jgi:nicotinamidase-related amidase
MRRNVHIIIPQDDFQLDMKEPLPWKRPRHCTCGARKQPIVNSVKRAGFFRGITQGPIQMDMGSR